MEPEELNNLKQQIEAVLADSQSKLTEISGILDNSKQKQAEAKQSFESIINDSQSKLTTISGLLDSSNQKEKELRIQIDNFLNEIQIKLASINATADSASQKEKDISAHQSRIIELKGAIENNSASLNQIYSDSLIIKQQLDQLYADATSTKNDIIKFHGDASAKLTEITTYYNNFLELKQKVDDSENGISASLNKVLEVFNQINKTKDETNNAKEQIITNKLQSDKVLKDSTELKDSIQLNYNTSEELKVNIGKILNLVSNTGLANSFDQRRKRSQFSIYIASGVITAGIITSAVLINKVFFSNSGQLLFDTIPNDYIKFLLRLTLTAPGVFLTWFGAVQYSKERYFLEQYEFKTAAALALENYTNLLKTNYAGREKEIFDLTVELIRSVYKEPEYVKPKTGFLAKFNHVPTKTNVEAQIKTE